jgi:two-component system CheB/CheR fusion protein
MSRATRKIRVFVVEDHPAIARGLQMFLEAVGLSVEIAFDMQSALAVLPMTKFDVLLCDLALPDGTGWELMKKLTKSGPVPAVAFSAFDDPEDVERSRNAGFAEHVAKGAPAEQLVEAIERTARARVRSDQCSRGTASAKVKRFPVQFTALVSSPNEQAR